MPSVHWRVSGASFPENSLKNPSIAAAARSGQARSNAAFGPVVMKSRDLYQGALSPGWARLASNLRASRRENGGSSAKTRKMVGNRGAEPRCLRRRGVLARRGRGKYCRVPGGPGVLSVSLYGDETGAGETPPNPAMRHPGVALACTEKASIANRALPFFFSLVLALHIPQQRPRENHGQDETHENAEDDINRDHKRVTKIPPSPNTRTTPPIIAATNATFLLSKSSLCSKSSAITTPT